MAKAVGGQQVEPVIGEAIGEAQPATAPEKAAPFVSVIVPVYDDAARLVRCLEALEKQTYPPDRYEVVVVDNASPEPLAPLLKRFPHAVSEFEATPGSYAARNRGIEASRGEILAFTDADCLPDERWLEAGVQGLQSRGSGIAGGRIEVFPSETARPTAVELYEMLYAFPQARLAAENAATANLFARRSVFEEVGGFDPSLKSFGDVVWTSRAVAAGYGIEPCAAAVVRHPARRTLAELRRRYARFAGGHYDRGRTSPETMRRERLKSLLFVLPPLRILARVLLTPSPPGLAAKARVIGVACFARWCYVLEWCRLELGARSRRR